MWRVLIGLALALALIVPQAVFASAGTLDAPTRIAIENEVIIRINQARAEVGCGPLLWEPRLGAAARQHNFWQAERGIFAHYQNGSTPRQRALWQGYRARRMSEIIVVGVDTPEEALWWWMHSPVHRAAILTCAYREIGVSFTYGAAPYYTYVTAKLATE